MNKIAQLGRLAARQRMTKQGGPLDSAGTVANAALQSPMGQGALNFGANMYNQIPQGGRDMISGMAHQYFPRADDAQGSQQQYGFTADPSQGVGIDSSTEYRTGTTTGGDGTEYGRMPQNFRDTQSPYGNTQEYFDKQQQDYDELTERHSSMTPGHAGSPFGQLMGGIMGANSQMPTRTYPRGTPLAREYGFETFNGEDLRDKNVDRLVPQDTMDRQYGGAAGLGQAAAQQRPLQGPPQAGVPEDFAPNPNLTRDQRRRSDWDYRTGAPKDLAKKPRPGPRVSR